LRSGHVNLAEQHLQAARTLEQGAASSVDRMRRLRVEALLADACGQHAVALRYTQSALSLAEAHGVDRYELLLMADMAWTHLQMGHADAAVTAFQELLLHLDHSIRQGLARARAMSGLTAALVAAGRIDEALRGAERSVRALQQANLLRSRCDVQTAAQLVGAGDEFSARSETEPDPISQLARKRAIELIDAQLSDEERTHWFSQGASAGDVELTHLLESAFPVSPPPKQQEQKT
jgi:tetratricopeptide (TPR) repeat protein